MKDTYTGLLLLRAGTSDQFITIHSDRENHGYYLWCVIQYTCPLLVQQLVTYDTKEQAHRAVINQNKELVCLYRYHLMCMYCR